MVEMCPFESFSGDLFHCVNGAIFKAVSIAMVIGFLATSSHSFVYNSPKPRSSLALFLILIPRLPCIGRLPPPNRVALVRVFPDIIRPSHSWDQREFAVLAFNVSVR